MEISTIDRRSGRGLRALVNVLCAVVMLFAVSFIAPAAFGLQRYVITGDSMSGTMDVGSVAFAEVVPVGDLEVGDVITYRPPAESGVDQLVTHRIVSIDGQVFRTKGDANAEVDAWTFRITDNTQSRVKYSVPYLGYVLIGLEDRAVRMVLIGIPAALVALLGLRQLMGALRGRASKVTPAPAPKTPVSVGG